MNVVEKIETVLQQSSPHLKYTAEPSSIQVLPASEDGFVVGFEEGASDYTVYFGAPGWHLHSRGNLKQALFWFAMGLSNQCRMQVVSRGGRDYRWVVERRLDNRWVQVGRSISPLFPFWEKSQSRYGSNAWLQDPRAFVEQMQVATLSHPPTSDDYRQTPVSRRKMAQRLVFTLVVLSIVLVMNISFQSGWLRAASAIVGAAVVVGGLAAWMEYRKRGI